MDSIRVDQFFAQLSAGEVHQRHDNHDERHSSAGLVILEQAEEGSDDQGQHTRERANADPENEDRYIEQRFDGTQHVENRPYDEVNPDQHAAAAGQVFCREEAERQFLTANRSALDQAAHQQNYAKNDQQRRKVWTKDIHATQE